MHLHQLENSELVRRLREPDLAYLFQHTLIQETTRNTLLNQERKRLNLLVGETLEELYPERRVELAALLAQHFAAAGADVKTIDYAEMAGDAEVRVAAYAEALAHYTLSLELAVYTKARASRLQDLFLKRGRVLEVTNQFNAALENYAEMSRQAAARNDRALELASICACATIYSIPSTAYDAARAQELTGRALELARELGDNAAQAKILWNLMLMHSRVGRGFPLALQYGLEALEIARQYHLREREAYLLNDLSPVLVFYGDPERGKQYNLQAREMWSEFQNLPMLAGNLGYAVMNYLVLGEYDAAIAASEEGLRLSRDINNAWNEAFAQTWIGQVYIERGEIETAERVMLAAVRMGERVFPPTLILTRSDLAVFYAEFGDTTRGIELAEQAVAAADRIFPAMRPKAAGALAHAAVLAGELERARAVMQDSPDIRKFTDNPMYVIDITLGEVALALAENDYQNALELTGNLVHYLRKSKLRYALPQALRARGLAHLGLNELDDAAAALEEARTLALDMDAKWSLLQVLEAIRALELARENTAAAETMRAGANALVAFFAARTPEPLRSSFLMLPHIRDLVQH